VTASTAACKHYTTAWRSREKARDTDAALLYICPHVTDLLLPAPSTGCGRPARFMLPMLISAVGTIPTIDEVNVLSACYGAMLPCPLQSANAFSLWVLSRQVWMQLQLEHRFWKNVTGARFWKRVPDNRILLNNLTRYCDQDQEIETKTKNSILWPRTRDRDQDQEIKTMTKTWRPRPRTRLWSTPRTRSR